MDRKILHVSSKHPLNKLSARLKEQLIRAQTDAIETEFSSAFQLCDRVFADLKMKVRPPSSIKDVSAIEFGDRPSKLLVDFFCGVLLKNRVPEQAAPAQAAGLAHRTQLIRAFSDVDSIIDQACEKVSEIVDSFPRTAEQIKRGRNPGDVLDPYILSAAQVLMFANDFERTISAAVSHKVLMIIEGLMGHLHEDILGSMRGNVRAPEPRGTDQEAFDWQHNPFPGADIVQPPLANGRGIRFHQVKSKTGSAKGGDGRRLGIQLQVLTDTYGGHAFYDALIGHTLRGHRSMTGVLKAAPDVVVLVGESAFRELTGSDAGPQLLLRLYQSAFEVAVNRSGYSFAAVIATIYNAFQERSSALGEDFLESVLRDAISGTPDQQDSRCFVSRKRGTSAEN